MKETQNIEFKRLWRDDFLAELCGFANAQGGTLFIGVDDRVELWNIGTLPEGFTVETLMAEHDSRPRNMLIAKVFYLAGFIEAWGRGYEKIRKAFKSEKLQFPTFEQVRGGMLATIPRERFVAISNGISQKSGQETEGGTETTQKTTEKTTEKILRLIKENPSITNKELAMLCEITEDGVFYHIKKMKAAGVIRRIGPDKGGHWEVIEHD